MPKVSISEAARLAEVERSTLYRKRNKSELSFDTDRKGNTVIDLSELGRVYPDALATYARQHPQQQVQQDATTHATPATTHKDWRIRELELENQAKDKEIERIETRVGELVVERDEWREQAKRLTLTYQPMPEPPQKPVEAGKEYSVGDDAEAENTPQRSNMAFYALFLIVLMGMIGTLNYFNAEVKAFIDRMFDKQPIIEEQKENDIETPVEKPQQSFPLPYLSPQSF